LGVVDVVGSPAAVEFVACGCGWVFSAFFARGRRGVINFGES